jgi:hypothetical protein
MGATYRADTVIVGGGLAGLVTALELLDAGQSVVLLDAGPTERLGGLARDAFGGVLVVNSPEQRRGRIRDSPELALSDWLTYGELDAGDPADEWPRRWAEAYVNGARELLYDWLHGHGVRFLPVVHWVERGGDVPGNSVPRFHIVWGTGRRLIEVLLARIDAHPNKDRLLTRVRHQVCELNSTAGRIVGVTGNVLGGVDGAEVTNDFSAEGGAVVIAAGGVAGDLAQVRARWSDGAAPSELLNGAHPVADGAMHAAAERRGARITHLDRVWCYAAGVRHWKPRFPDHGLSLVPPRSALWLNWEGKRFEAPPLVSGFDTSQLVQRVGAETKQHSWLILNARIARRELAVSGAEFNAALRDREPLQFARTLLLGNTELVTNLLDNCPDFVAAESVADLVARMHEVDDCDDVDGAALADAIRRYDATAADKGSGDEQRRRVAAVRRNRGDWLRTCKAARIDDPRGRPLIAIRQRITTRKSMGGIQTDLGSRVLNDAGQAVAGLFAVGEAAGFGGGGMHGKRSLEGTFLGGCVITARAAAQTIIAG